MNKKFKDKSEKRKRLLKKEKEKRLLKAEENNIKKIWDEFLKTEIREFETYSGINRRTIEKIGIAKFIKALGYQNVKDVPKWRKDKFHIVVCPDCRKEFGVYEMYSVCQYCEKKYDINKINKSISAIAQSGEYASDFYMAFMYYKQMRDFYLLDNKNEDKECIYLLKYNDKTAKFEVSIVEDVETGDIVQFIMSDGSVYEEDEYKYFEITEKKEVENNVEIGYKPNNFNLLIGKLNISAHSVV